MGSVVLGVVMVLPPMGKFPRIESRFHLKSCSNDTCVTSYTLEIALLTVIGPSRTESNPSTGCVKIEASDHPFVWPSCAINWDQKASSVVVAGIMMRWS